MFDWTSEITKNIDAFFQRLGDLGKQQQDIIGIAVLLVGALFAFLGFRFFKYLLGLAGFLAGALVGLTLFYYIPGINNTGEIGQLVVGAVVGAGGAVLFYFIFYYFGVFVFGSVAAMWLGMVFLPRFSDLDSYRLLIILGLGFVGGLLALLMRRLLIIIGTSIIGAVLVTFGIGHFANWPVAPENLTVSGMLSGEYIGAVIGHGDGVIIGAVLIVCAVSGMAVQWRTARVQRAQEPN